MDKEIIKAILKEANIKGASSIERVQELWSGFGSLIRVKSNESSVIIKLVKIPMIPNHPRGWNSNFSLQRKNQSYLNEALWYKRYAHLNQTAYTPSYIISGRVYETQYLILEDLQVKNFETLQSVSKDQIFLTLNWLASFHAYHIGKNYTDLWDKGTYWHLQTRPDEYEKMKDLELKTSASDIDKKLNKAKYQTIIHGDAKLANFLFNKTEVAGIDFQYVGTGVGIKDIMLFFSSIMDSDELFKYADTYLDFYFTALTNLTQNSEIEAEWRDLYKYAWCDFYRFLNGWCPDHYKVHSYSNFMRDEALKCL